MAAESRTPELFSLSGKVALVTGGSRGIGAMMVRGLLEAGAARVYITARREKELVQARDELSQYGEVVAIPSDLSTMEGIRGLASAVCEAEDKLHILVNNAGAAWGAPIDEFPEAGFDKVMNVNVKAPFFLVQQLLGPLRAAGTAEDPARVVNIASINGLTNPHDSNYSYSASKAGVIQLTRHLAADLAKDHISVNGIAPGLFPTKMVKHALDDPEVKSALLKSIPRQRAGSWEDAAGTVVYLTSRASAFVTGHTVVLDGGVVANS